MGSKSVMKVKRERALHALRKKNYVSGKNLRIKHLKHLLGRERAKSRSLAAKLAALEKVVGETIETVEGKTHNIHMFPITSFICVPVQQQ